MFVEDKLSTLAAVAKTPGFEAWELFLGARACAIVEGVSEDAGGERGEGWVIALTHLHVCVCVCVYHPVTWGYNTQAERDSVAQQQRIRLLELPQFGGLMEGKAV